MGLAVGDEARRAFHIDDAAMAAFQALSGDVSLIHTDPDYARSRGFDGVIAYGGLFLAHLSHTVGMLIPGVRGLSTRWSINYRRPMYPGQSGEIILTVVNVSAATGLVDCRFRIESGGKTVATGETQSLLPPEDLAP
jgi:acyl dehydratase